MAAELGHDQNYPDETFRGGLHWPPQKGGRPGLETDEACALLIKVTGNSVGGAPEALKATLVDKFALTLGTGLSQASGKQGA